MMMLRRQSKRLANIVQAWRRNSDGVAAVEFAFIAPILIIMLFGVFEMGRAYSAHRRFLSASYMIGDLVAREKELTTDGLRGIYQLAPTVMGGYSSDKAILSVEVLPVQIQASKPDEVRSYATPERFNKTIPSCGAQIVSDDVKDILKSSTQGLIVVTSTYEYKPLFASSIVGSMTWTNVSTFAPRQQCVTFGTGTAAKSCSKPC